MRIAVASDHAGFKLKEMLKEHLAAAGHEVADCGAASEERSDYPDYAKEAASLISKGKAERGILVCGSGIGMCIAANRYKGVRAVVIRDENDAVVSRQHNDANAACLGARVTGPDEVRRLVDLFLKTAFEGGRHIARVAKIDI
ncbi:MAG: ribose 5-phosphate isomerase B [Pseudomonadota bacterium]